MMNLGFEAKIAFLHCSYLTFVALNIVIANPLSVFISIWNFWSSIQPFVASLENVQIYEARKKAMLSMSQIMSCIARGRMGKIVRNGRAMGKVAL